MEHDIFQEDFHCIEAYRQKKHVIRSPSYSDSIIFFIFSNRATEVTKNRHLVRLNMFVSLRVYIFFFSFGCIHSARVHCSVAVRIVYDKPFRMFLSLFHGNAKQFLAFQSMHQKCQAFQSIFQAVGMFMQIQLVGSSFPNQNYFSLKPKKEILLFLSIMQFVAYFSIHLSGNLDNFRMKQT